MPEPAFPQPESKKPESIEAIPSEDVLSLPGSSVDAPTKPTEVDPMADTERDEASPGVDLPSVREGDAPPFPPLRPEPDTERDAPPTSVDLPSVQGGEAPPLSGPAIDEEADIAVTVDLSKLQEEGPLLQKGPVTDPDADVAPPPRIWHTPHWEAYPEGYAPQQPHPSPDMPPEDRIDVQPSSRELQAMQREYQTYSRRSPDSDEPTTRRLHPVPPVSAEEVRLEEAVPSHRIRVSGDPNLPPFVPSKRKGTLGVWDRVRHTGFGRKKVSGAEISGRGNVAEKEKFEPPHAPSVLNPIESDEDRKEFGGEEEGRAEVA